MQTKQEQLEKHKRYKSQYKPNDLYWGLGIERECYLEVEGDPVTGQFFNNQHRERYSVDYFKSYKPKLFNEVLHKIIDQSGSYNLPVLINAHSFLKCDAEGHHKTLFKKDNPINPLFSGKTLFEELQLASPYFSKEYDNSFTFDGDTIELITQHFYKASVSSTVAEIIQQRDKFISEFRLAIKNISTKHPIFQKEVRWMSKNYPVVRMFTNMQNIGIFNNGTYHINITLPTQLDNKGNIKDFNKFISRHQNVINYYQWLEPFLIAQYGTPDFLSATDSRFAKGSQRNALSRYIGVGSYDSTKMEKGKLLQTTSIPYWMKQYHSNSAYEQLEKIGLDINFNKHFNHGIELRIFDWFPEEHLEELISVLVHSADAALEIKPPSPIKNISWNKITEKIIREGSLALFSTEELEQCLTHLGVPLKLFLKKKSYTAASIWKIISQYISRNYTGECTEKMIGPEVHLARCFHSIKL
jgi:hypothetical protein